MSDSHAPTSNQPPTPIDPARARQSPPRLTLTGDTHFEDEFDALADLFLEEDESERAGTPMGDPDRLPIEGLILGHLPVSASSWVKTYAAMRARALGGPVGLVRVMGDSMAIDLVGVDRQGGSEALTLDEAIEALRRRAVSVVVRTDEIREPELARHGVDGLVVLSGADEAAIAGAFRTIRSVVEEATRHGEIPAIRCAIFGEPRERAQEAFDRLARSVRHSLSCDLAFGGSVQRLASETSETLYAGATTVSCADLLQRLHTQPGGGYPPRPSPESPGSLDTTKAQEEPEVLTQAGVDDGAETDAAPGTSIEAPQPAPSPAALDDATVDDVPARPDLASLLAGVIEGACPTEIRSPYAPEIEILLDGEGFVRVVSGMDDLGRAMGVLAWAQDHEALLRLAEPSIRGVREALVVVCDDARDARALLDTAHRVVLRVRLGDQETCVPLN